MGKEASKQTLNTLRNNAKDLFCQLESVLPAMVELNVRLSQSEKSNDKESICSFVSGVENLLLGSYFILHELLASLKLTLDSNSLYEKRYHLQCINECACEAYEYFIGRKNNGVLINLNTVVKNLRNPILKVYADNIETELRNLGEHYCNIELRNCTAHYDKPEVIYEKQAIIIEEDSFCKIISQCMLIHMHISHFSGIAFAVLFKVLPKIDKMEKSNMLMKQTKDLKAIIESKLAEKFASDNSIQNLSEKSLEVITKLIDSLYQNNKRYGMIYSFCKERNIDLPICVDVMHQLCLIRMMVSYMRCDIVCAMRAYINSETCLERAMHLRKIYLTEVSALKHLYGYNERSRSNSLWTKLMAINCEYDNGEAKIIGEELDAYESHLDNTKRNLYSHFRENKQLNITNRYEAYKQLNQISEINEALKLMGLCKSIEEYTTIVLERVKNSENKKHQKQMKKCRIMFDQMRNMIVLSDTPKKRHAELIAMINNTEEKLMSVYDINNNE